MLRCAEEELCWLFVSTKDCIKYFSWDCMHTWFAQVQCLGNSSSMRSSDTGSSVYQKIFQTLHCALHTAVGQRATRRSPLPMPRFPNEGVS